MWNDASHKFASPMLLGHARTRMRHMFSGLIGLVYVVLFEPFPWRGVGETVLAPAYEALEELDL